MAFQIKNWFNKGSTTKTPVNAKGLNDLEQRISNALKNECEIGVTDTGYYFKYDNGILIYLGNVTMPAITEAWSAVDVTVKFPIPYTDTKYFCDSSFMSAARGFSYRSDCFTRNTGSLIIRNYNGSTDPNINALTVSYFTVGLWK